MGMFRSRAFILGALLAVTVGVFAAASGGFPSRPRFQAVGVGVTAPATAGHVTATQYNGSGAGLTAIPAAQLSGVVSAQYDSDNILRVTGPSNVPGSGAGIELFYTGGTGILQPYDRGGAAYRPLRIVALSAKVSLSGGTDQNICLEDGTGCPATSIKQIGFIGVWNSATAPTVTATRFASAGVSVAANAAACASAICQFDLTGFTGSGTVLCVSMASSNPHAMRRGSYSGTSPVAFTAQSFDTTTGTATGGITFDVVCTGS